MHGDKQVDSDEGLVQRLLADQFPEFAELPVRRLATDGTDNAMYRVGDDLVARLPLVEWAREQVDTDAVWLPRLAPHLPLAVPEPVVIGEPGHGYPWRWAIHRWIDGATAHPDTTPDLVATAHELAAFVLALRAVDLPDAPRSKRGDGLASSDRSTRWAIDKLQHQYDAAALTAVWEAALDVGPWSGPPMLVHGDLTDGNVLVRNGRVHAVIDWSLFGFGEPANDLDVVWCLFSGESRAAYRAALAVDDATWTRGRGWAVMSVFGIVYYEHTNSGIVARCRRRLDALLEER